MIELVAVQGELVDSFGGQAALLGNRGGRHIVQFRVVNGVTLVWAVPISSLDHRLRSDPPGQQSKNKKKDPRIPLGR